MQPGDLIEMEGQRFLVRVVLRRAGVARIVSPQGREFEIPWDSDMTGDAKVIVNVPKLWPITTAPTKRGAGPFREIIRPRIGFAPTVLIPFVDWVPSDPVREGGPVFFNPSLNLRHGDVLVAKHDKGALSRIAIPVKFGTFEMKKKAAEEKAAPRQRDAFDVLMDDDE